MYCSVHLSSYQNWFFVVLPRATWPCAGHVRKGAGHLSGCLSFLPQFRTRRTVRVYLRHGMHIYSHVTVYLVKQDYNDVGQVNQIYPKIVANFQLYSNYNIQLLEFVDELLSILRGKCERCDLVKVLWRFQVSSFKFQSRFRQHVSLKVSSFKFGVSSRLQHIS